MLDSFSFHVQGQGDMAGFHFFGYFFFFSTVKWCLEGDTNNLIRHMRVLCILRQIDGKLDMLDMHARLISNDTCQICIPYIYSNIEFLKLVLTFLEEFM